MIKRCQIHAVFPITCFTVPIVGNTELNLNEEEIYKCLCAKAEVTEILRNGKTVRLDFTNYNKDNEVKIEDKENSTIILTDVEVNGLPVEELAISIEKSEIKEDLEAEDKIEAAYKKIEDGLKGTEEPGKVSEPLTKTHEVASRNNYRNNNKNNYKKIKK